MLLETIFAGFGGQGVMSMGMVLAHAAMQEGRQVSWLPSYGPEQRGGTANCMVVISDRPIGSPLVTDPDVAVVMNRPSLTRFGPAVRTGGLLFVNASMIEEVPAYPGVGAVPVDALRLAEEAGDARVANMVMLGAVIGLTAVVSLSAAVAALGQVLPERRHRLLEANAAALALGAAFAAERAAAEAVPGRGGDGLPAS